MKGSPFTGPRWNALCAGPGPDSTEKLSIKSCTAQIMQDTGDLILSYQRRLMPQSLRHGRAHPGGPESMGTVIAPDAPPRATGVGIVVQMQEFGSHGAGHQKRNGRHARVRHAM